MKILIVSLIGSLLSGCAALPSFDWGKKPAESVVIKREEVARAPLNLPDPQPIITRPVTWIVVTPENVNRVWQDLKNKRADLVLFAITDDGYEQLAVDFATIRNFLEQQRQIIAEYRKYYETAKPADAKEKQK